MTLVRSGVDPTKAANSACVLPTGDIAWMVRHDDTGVIVPDADPAAFADAIAALFDDPTRAARLAARAAAELPRYTWPVVGPQWQEVYQSPRTQALTHPRTNTAE